MFLGDFSKTATAGKDAYETELYELAAALLPDDLLDDHSLERDAELENNATARDLKIASVLAKRKALLDAVAQEMVQWPQGTCGRPGAFTEDVGSLYVTRRVDLGRNFVL